MYEQITHRPLHRHCQAVRPAPPASAHCRRQRRCCRNAPPRRLRPPVTLATGGAGANASTEQQQQAKAVYLEDAATNSFLAWARGAGIEFARVRPATFAGLRSLAAAAAIRADDVVLSVPRAAALTLPPRARCPCADYVTSEFWDSAPWFAKLGVRLLAEKRKGAASKYAAYLASLPRDVDTPVTWPEERLAQLQYPHILAAVAAQRREWDELHQRVCAAMAPGAQAPPRADFFWALAAVRSRTFSGPYVASTLSDRLRLAALVGFLAVGNVLAVGPDGIANSAGAAIAVFLFNVLYEVTLSGKLKQYAMCPAIDLANHASAGTAEASYDYFRDAFVVAAGRDYAPGAQVFVSYGAQSNDSLMQLYGFAEPDNPADSYVMHGGALLKWVAELAPPDPARIAKLAAAGLLRELEGDAIVTRAGLSARALQALRFLLAPPAAAAGAGDARGPGAFESAADAETEARVALALAHVVRRELEALGTTLEDDMALAAGAGKRGGSGGSGGGRPDPAALAFRIEKKKVLRACLDALMGK